MKRVALSAAWALIHFKPFNWLKAIKKEWAPKTPVQFKPFFLLKEPHLVSKKTTVILTSSPLQYLCSTTRCPSQKTEDILWGRGIMDLLLQPHAKIEEAALALSHQSRSLHHWGAPTTRKRKGKDSACHGGLKVSIQKNQAYSMDGSHGVRQGVWRCHWGLNSVVHLCHFNVAL